MLLMFPGEWDEERGVTTSSDVDVPFSMRGNLSRTHKRVVWLVWLVEQD